MQVCARNGQRPRPVVISGATGGQFQLNIIDAGHGTGHAPEYPTLWPSSTVAFVDFCAVEMEANAAASARPRCWKRAWQW